MGLICLTFLGKHSMLSSCKSMLMQNMASSKNLTILISLLEKGSDFVQSMELVKTLSGLFQNGVKIEILDSAIEAMMKN